MINHILFIGSLPSSNLKELIQSRLGSLRDRRRSRETLSSLGNEVCPSLIIQIIVTREKDHELPPYLS
jgi:hypothetical protein